MLPTKLVECVPNFSEGRDTAKMEKILDCFRGKAGVKLLDYSHDTDHNRMVVTIAGQPEPVRDTMIQAIGTAVQLIDLNHHTGEHPRMGAADVVPFIPISHMTMDEAITLSREVGQEVARQFDLPVYLYESAATAPHRVNLAEVRKGEFEGLAEKMENPLWKPDFGPDKPHPTAGASIIGARHFLIAYNINLHTDRLDIAKAIAKRIRHSSGGLRYCKALGVALTSQSMVQVSINLTDFSRTSLYQVFEMVRMEAGRYGVEIANSELIGMIPLQALADTAAYYLRFEALSIDKVLEYKIWE
ncbi:MAG: glutamate formimidoyltransferase [Bacteroidota bacterium]|nr:glutamate formimidoyltransferase [Bacteroidota bacterium]